MNRAIVILSLLALSACSGGDTVVDEKSLAKEATALDHKADTDVNRMIADIDAAEQKDEPPHP